MTDTQSADPKAAGALQHEMRLLPLDLLSIIETQIIPRLAAAHPGGAPGDERRRLRIAAFTRTILEGGLDAASAQAEALMASGLSLNALFLDLFTPTAVALGEMWAADELSFIEVTLASYKLHRLVRSFGATHARLVSPGKRRVLLSPLPTNKHTLGVLMVENLFLGAGWTVHTLPASAQAELVGCLHREWFDAVGLSVSCDQGADIVPAMIAAIRSESLNPRIVVLVGGSFFDSDPGLATKMGSDAHAGDAAHAVAEAIRLVDAR